MRPWRGEGAHRRLAIISRCKHFAQARTRGKWQAREYRHRLLVACFLACSCAAFGHLPSAALHHCIDAPAATGPSTLLIVLERYLQASTKSSKAKRSVLKCLGSSHHQSIPISIHGRTSDRHDFMQVGKLASIEAGSWSNASLSAAARRRSASRPVRRVTTATPATAWPPALSRACTGMLLTSQPSEVQRNLRWLCKQ